MKGFILSLTILASVFAQAQDFSTPQNTFETLLKAIQNEDLELYRQCWADESLEDEGMYTDFKEDPQLWEELHGIFKGPQSLKQNQPDPEAKKFTTTIVAPEGEGGGIGSITMILVGDEWKMHNW